MKKLLIIPALLALTLFSIYHNKIEGKKVYEEPTVIKKMEQENFTQYSHTYTKKKENNQSEEKIFTVETTAEVNTTRDNETTLTARVLNETNIEACNFFWYEKNELIGIGSTIYKNFSKGRHTLTVVAKNADGDESNATVTVRAWDYKKVETLHFSAEYGELEYKEIDIYDHKGRCLILDDKVFSKYIYVYDEDDNRVEHSVIYYKYPEESTKWLYSYDENHNQLTFKTIDITTGQTTYYNVRTYDEDGNETSSKSGQNEDELQDDYAEYSNEDDTDYVEYNSTYVANKDDRTTLNDNGDVIYEERNYDYSKTIDKYSYDEESNKMTQHISTSINYNNREETYIYNYDENETQLNTEHIYKIDNKLTCHDRTTSTYNEEYREKTEKIEILDGICLEYREDSFKEFSYDKDGRLSNIITSLDQESDDNQTTLKIIKSYTNELEE